MRRSVCDDRDGEIRRGIRALEADVYGGLALAVRKGGSGGRRGAREGDEREGEGCEGGDGELHFG